jgi:4'-phosphopantetheinyl transferase EntD
VAVTAAIDAADVGTALRELAPAGVVTGALAVDHGYLAELRPEEAALVATAVTKRQQEFATGRVLLHRLLTSDAALLRAANGAPALPPGWRATLAHDRQIAVAAATRDPAVAALGIDVEPAAPLTAELAAIILRDDEAGIDAHLAFSLKEAAYKAWSATGGGMLEHHDVHLELGPGEAFSARVVDAGVTLRGRYAHAGGRVLALVVA